MAVRLLEMSDYLVGASAGFVRLLNPPELALPETAPAELGAAFDQRAGFDLERGKRCFEQRAQLHNFFDHFFGPLAQR